MCRRKRDTKKNRKTRRKDKRGRRKKKRRKKKGKKTTRRRGENGKSEDATRAHRHQRIVSFQGQTDSKVRSIKSCTVSTRYDSLLHSFFAFFLYVILYCERGRARINSYSRDQFFLRTGDGPATMITRKKMEEEEE